MLSFLESARVKYTLVLTKADAAGPPTRAAQMTALTLASVRNARKFTKPPAIVSARILSDSTAPGPVAAADAAAAADDDARRADVQSRCASGSCSCR